MTKNELITKIATQTGLTADQAKAAVESAFATITAELSANREVMITGFGKFTAHSRQAREGRNPATGETMQIAASTAAKFTAAAGLKKQLNP